MLTCDLFSDRKKVQVGNSYYSSGCGVKMLRVLPPTNHFNTFLPSVDIFIYLFNVHPRPVCVVIFG